LAGPSGTADRPTDIIGRFRALVRSAAPQNDQLDVNETMLEVIALTRSELRSSRISLQTVAKPGGCRVCPPQNFRCYSNCQGGFNSLIRRNSVAPRRNEFAI
jgi:hypothetical protein